MLAALGAPSRYIQGRDASAALGVELTGLGIAGPILIVAGRTPRRLLAETWAASLAAAGIAFTIHDFGGECSLAEIGRIVESARAAGARAIVGAGGGKALDAARGAAERLTLPVVCCPTIASTDSPCSALAVIYSEDGVVQGSELFRRNPDLVLVDTTIVSRAPARYLVAGMGDALATWFEARTCALSHAQNLRRGASTRTALAIAELCYRTLREDGLAAKRAVEAQAITPALERVVEANVLLSGIGFESSGLAAAHAIHNGFTAVPQTHGYEHGEKVSFGTLVQLVLEGTPQAEVDEVLDFATSVGLPVTLAGIGCGSLTEEELMIVARRATREDDTMRNEPFPVSPEMLIDAIRAADAIGRARLAEAGR